MQRTPRNLDPGDLYQCYVRDLMLVARCGERDVRQLFLHRYAPQLSGLTGYLGHLSEDEQQVAFDDALRAREGGWPHSLVGFRLAVPRWFVRRVHDPFGLWKANARYLPDGFAVDPCSCCPQCLRFFQQECDREALPVAG